MVKKFFLLIFIIFFGTFFTNFLKNKTKELDQKITLKKDDIFEFKKNTFNGKTNFKRNDFESWDPKNSKFDFIKKYKCIRLWRVKDC